MPVLLDSSFNTGDNAYVSGPSHPRAKIVELVWNPAGGETDGYSGYIGLLVEVGDVDGYGTWTKGDNSQTYNLRIEGIEYYNTITEPVSDAGASIYSNVKTAAYDWLSNNTRFTGTLE